jgi:hypothetical protein
VKPVSLNLAAIRDPAVRAVLSELATASRLNDIVTIAQNYQISGAVTTTRSLTPSTATTTQVANFVATLILDVQRGGAFRTG